MAIDKEKIDKIRNFLDMHRKSLVIVALIIMGVYFIFFSGSGDKQPGKVENTVKPEMGQLSQEEKTRLEISALKQQNEELKKQIEQLTKQGQAQKEKPETLESVKELEKTLKGSGENAKKKKEIKLEEPLPTEQKIITQPIAPLSPPRIIKIDIPKEERSQPVQQIQPKQSSNVDIFLPAGSFASFTLTSGAYAPSGGEQMPVSAVIDKFFIGPNKSMVPLKGCFFVGKARGIIREKIADIKPINIACVWDDGTTFEGEVAGYVTDENGRFGLPGKVNRHEGTFFATAGLSAFFSGLAGGWSRAYEQETTAVTEGVVEKTINIMGNAFRYGALKGLAALADAAKGFYEAQMKELIPSVDVAPGTRGYVYITKGITIKGGKKQNEKIYPYTVNTVRH